MMSVTIGTLEDRPLSYTRRGIQRAYKTSMFLLSRTGEIVWHGVILSIAFALVAYVALGGDGLLLFLSFMLCLHVLWMSTHELLDNRFELVLPSIFVLPMFAAIGITNGILQPPFYMSLALAVAVGLAGVAVLLPVFLLSQALFGRKQPATPET